MAPSCTAPPTALMISFQGPIAKEVYKQVKRHREVTHIIVAQNKTSKSIISTFQKTSLRLLAHYAICKGLYFIFRANLYSSKTTETILYANSKESLLGIAQELTQSGVKEIIVCGFRMVLPRDFFDKFDRCMNIHTSILPNYRGADPLTWQMVAKEKEYGLTMHIIDDNVDTGPILSQKSVAIKYIWLRAQIEWKLSELVDSLIADGLYNKKPKKQPGGGWRNPLPTRENLKSYLKKRIK